MTLDDTLIIAAFGAMSTVITVMWQKLSGENAKLNERADNCEKDRQRLFAAVATMTGDSELLDHCPSPKCPFRKDRSPQTPDHLNNPIPLHP